MIDYVRCTHCGKRCSQDVEAGADGLIVRAYVACPECVDAGDDDCLNPDYCGAAGEESLCDNCEKTSWR